MYGRLLFFGKGAQDIYMTNAGQYWDIVY